MLEGKKRKSGYLEVRLPMKVKKQNCQNLKRLTLWIKVMIIIKYLSKVYKDMQLKFMPEDCANISNTYKITLKN